MTYPPPLPHKTKIPRVKRIVLKALILETEEFCPPMPKRLKARILLMTNGEEDFKVGKHLDWLVEHGFAIQHHKYGPYVPLKTDDGTTLSLTLIEVLNTHTPTHTNTHAVNVLDRFEWDPTWTLTTLLDLENNPPDRRPPDRTLFSSFDAEHPKKTPKMENLVSDGVFVF